MVLTQPLRTDEGEPGERMFPYHYGSYATLTLPPNSRVRTSCFHTTMVLTQQISNVLLTKSAKVFPYHYGSYATNRKQKGVQRILKGFHTTMVLTQRIGRDIQGICCL